MSWFTESADDDYTLAPHVEVRPPVAQGSGATSPRATNAGALVVCACAGAYTLGLALLR